MLEEQKFKQYFEPITNHYRHEVSPPILKIYYEYLSQKLTEEEFMEALKQSIVKLPVYRGLPSPEQIVELILGSRESKALQEWQMVVQAASRSDSESLAYLSNRGHIALSAIGGLNAVAYHEGGLQWIQKDFMQVYCQCSESDVKVLKQAPVEKPRTNFFEEVENPIPTEKWQELKQMMRSIGRRDKNNIPKSGNGEIQPE